MLIITRSELQRLIPMERAIEAVAAAFVQLSAGQADVPLRHHLAVPPADALALIMPAYLAPSGALGVKLLTLFPHNAGGALPVIQAMLVLFDPTDGRALALMDGTYLTSLRTGAASGVATQQMARADAHTLVIFGAGAMAPDPAGYHCQPFLRASGSFSGNITRRWFARPNRHFYCVKSPCCIG